jgi:pyruvate dehydrogenase E2 component (dihydrolipoamide acetyltransferase)
MAVPIHTPRVNNNDDYVRFSHVFVSPGAAVKKGDFIAEIETDKATFTIEAEQDGYVLGFGHTPGETIAVGSVLIWMGSSPDEPIPTAESKPAAAATGGEPTLKAAILLARFGLSATDVPAAGERLTATDVLDHIQRLKITAPQESVATPKVSEEILPDLPAGESIQLSVTERGMIKTVAWHGRSAVPGYVEIEYPTAAWQQYADEFQQRHNTLLSPLLQLMAYRLVRLASENPRLNATITGDRRYQYGVINLGFTLQSGASLYLLSVKDADKLSEKEFVSALNALMSRGMKGKLTASDTSGVTIGFTSMSRWEVTRHMPILPPYTSLMVAHAYGANGAASLGATYDHRVLAGGDVAAALRALSRPPEGD